MRKSMGVKKAKSFIINQTSARLLTVFFAFVLLIAIAFSIFAKSMQDIYVTEKQNSRSKIISNISDSTAKVLSSTKDITGALYAYGIDKLFEMLQTDPSGCREAMADSARKYSYINTAMLISENGEGIYGASTNPSLAVSDFVSRLPYSYDELVNHFNSGRYAYELLLINKPTASSLYRGMEDFCFVQRIVSTKTGEMLGFFFVIYQRSEMREMTGINALTANETLMILNERDETVMCIGDLALPEPVVFNGLLRGLNKGTFNTADGERIDVYGGNETNQPYKTLLLGRYDHNVWSEYNRRFFSIIAICCISAILIIYLISVSFFQNKVIHNVQGLLQHKSKSQINRLLIEDAGSLEGMVSREIIYANRLEKQNDDHLSMMKRKMLLELFTSRTPLDADEEIRQLERIGINVTNQYFAVLVFDCSAAVGGCTQAEFAEQELELMRFVIENIFREYGECYAITVKDDVVCLFSRKDSLTVEEMRGYAGTVAEVCDSELSHCLKCGVGNISCGITDISQSYYRAVCALEFAQNEQKEICDYREIATEGSRQSDYAKSIEEKYHLLNLVKAHDYDNARAVFEKLLKNIVKDTNVSGEFVRLQIYETLRGIISEICSDISDSAALQRELNEKSGNIFYCRDTVLFEQTVLDIFDTAVAYAVQTSENQDDFLSVISDIVEKEYYNPDLSVSFIAERTGQNPRTLSAKFIKKTGKGLLDYIHSVRINHAKLLLTEKGKSVQEVSELVGYENPNTFIRVFKRYCEMTPGHYQELYKK